MLVVAVYNINKAITSNSLDAAIAPVKEKVAKMDEELSKKRQFGQDLMKEYKEIVQKVLDADIKFYKAADDDKTAEKEDAAGDDDLNLEL